jgi:hypothetical protein
MSIVKNNLLTIRSILIIIILYLVIGFVFSYYLTYSDIRMFNCEISGDCIDIIDMIGRVLANDGHSYSFILGWPIYLLRALFLNL